MLGAARYWRYSIPDRSGHLFRHARRHPRRRARPVVPVGAGRHADQAGEATAEGAQRRAADRETDLADAEVATTAVRVGVARLTFQSGFDPEPSNGRGMEHLWSRAVANGGNRWQMRRRWQRALQKPRSRCFFVQDELLLVERAVGVEHFVEHPDKKPPDFVAHVDNSTPEQPSSALLTAARGECGPNEKPACTGCAGCTSRRPVREDQRRQMATADTGRSLELPRALALNTFTRPESTRPSIKPSHDTP